MTDEDRRKLEEDDFLGLSPTTDELKPGEQLVRNPTDVWVEDWLKIDGVKSYWFCNIQLAEEAGFNVDALHRDIATLLGSVLKSDCEQAITDYLFDKHGILPSERIGLARLKDVLLLDSKQSHGNRKSRLVVTIDRVGDGSKAVFDGEPFPLSSIEAIFLDALIQAKNDWMSGTAIHKK